MRLRIKICLLLGILTPIIATYCYIYEESSMGLLPVINYPLRLYTLPLLILGITSLVLGIALYKFYSGAK